MEDSEKTKERLINELAKLGQQITKLKESEIKRKKAEEDLKKSQQEFASLFKNSPEALVYTDEKGKILDINPNFTALFGYTLKKIKGRNIDDGMITPPDKMKEAKKLTSEALNEDFYFETMREKKNGTLFPVAISGSRVIIGGRFKGLIASYRDITEHQKMIEDLKNSEEKYRSLYENMPGVYYRADREGNILMVNPPGAKLLGYNSPEEIIGKNLVKDFYYIPEDRKIFLEELKKRKGIVKDYVVTLKRRDGTPVIVSTSSHHCYDEKGNIIGVEGIFVDITERKEAEMAIIYEQSLLRALMENIPDFIYFKDEKNRFVRVNKASGEDRGITPEDFIGKTDFDIFTEEAAKKCFADDDRVMKTGKPLINRIEKITYLNGMERWFSATKVPRYDEKGKIIGTIGITRDITERKKAEEALQKSQQEFASLFNSSPEALVYEDAKSNIININPRFTELFGYTLAELKGRNLREGMTHPPDKLEEIDQLSKNLKGFSGYETIRKKKDGTLIEVSISSSPVIIDQQLRGFLTLYEDISRRKQVEKTIIYEQSLLLALMENISDHIYFKDKKKRFIRVNKAKAEYSEITAEKMIGKTDFDFFPPEIAKQSSADDDLVIETGKPIIDKVEKIIHSDKTEHWVSTTKVPWYNREGKITGLIGISRNITEREKAEEALQKSQQEFASLFNSSPEALVYVDAKSNILNINPRFTELFGYTLEELHGKNIDEGMIHPADKKEEGLRLNQNVKGLSNYETIRKRKDDTLIQVSISSSPVIVDNQIRGFLILYKDITERKQNEIMQKVLYNISQAANSPISLKQLYKTIHKELGSIIDTTNFYIALIDEKEDKIFFPYHVDEKDNNFPIRKFSTANTLTAYVIKNGQPLLNDNNQYKEMINQGILSPWGSTTPQSIWLGVPLKVEDRVIGAIVVQSYTNPHLYSEKDIKLLGFVSNQVSTAIERKKMEKELERLAHYDVLTGCCSRGYGLNLLEQQIKTAKRKKTPILLLYLDVDNFKYINDIFGHQEGDKVLKEAIKLFKSTLREVDVICRIGGDEFLLIFQENSLNDAPLIRERLNKNLEKLNQKLAKPYKIDLSIGLSCYNPSKPQPMYELIRIADKKMYEEKRRKNKGR